MRFFKCARFDKMCPVRQKTMKTNNYNSRIFGAVGNMVWEVDEVQLMTVHRYLVAKYGLGLGEGAG